MSKKNYIPTEEHRRKNSESCMGRIPWNRGRKETRIEVLEKQSNSHKGRHYSPNTEFKKGQIAYNKIGDGITPIYQYIRNSKEYNSWRFQIFEHDNFTCQCCGDTGKNNLEAHHIKSLSNIIKENNIVIFKSALSCDELWDLDNGITYCKECHELLNKKGGLL